ncbi:MAG TPA: glycerol kinase GlpK [Polyangiaceae bacterium]|nr:glycerol kinase GlpK [Polyangiaceae bacterium]
MRAYILAIDQGTTGSTALVMSPDGKTLSRENREFPQHFPAPGWVEHEPEEIWSSVEDAAAAAIRSAQVRGDEIAAIGITNQRETTLLWDRRSGEPAARAIVWQDRRTTEICQRLRDAGHQPDVQAVSGLVLDPYFSATKVQWLLDNTPGARARAVRGELCFGTVDSYLLWRLTGGAKSAVHLTDATNASRTLLMDLDQLTWSHKLCRLFDVPREVLPKIRPSAGEFGRTLGFGPVADGTPITGIAGDQHAALFGQGCFEPGDAKCTYGTGAFALVNAGSGRPRTHHGLLETLAWQIGDQVTYALEGSCFVAGAAIQWLRDGLGIIQSASEIEALARTVSSSEGVAFVSSLSGLGAPHWDAQARGMISGITRGTTRAHLARAALEGIAHQVDDLLAAMERDLGKQFGRLRVDGGAAANNLLMQLQADLSGMAVERPSDLESTARGAAMLAGLGVGLFATPNKATEMIPITSRFDVKMNEVERSRARARWADLIARARTKVEGEHD